MRYNYKWWFGKGLFLKTIEHRLLLEIGLLSNRDLFFYFIEIDSKCQNLNSQATILNLFDKTRIKNEHSFNHTYT